MRPLRQRLPLLTQKTPDPAGPYPNRVGATHFLC
jgi:hypothetical protein